MTKAKSNDRRADDGLTARRASSRCLLLATAGLAALIGQPAKAQGQADAAPQAVPSSDADDIVVTGSQVARSGFEAATPTTTIGAADLARVSAPNIADAINQLPALRASLTPSSSTNLSVAVGGNFLDLRGLGFLRTLTLIDGRRYVPTTTTGGLNINTIPQALIETADIVTGGASAAYGSDAVAGVVNLRFNNDLEGLKGSLQGGITDHNDHRNYLASLAYGASFGGGRGHILLGAEAAQNSGIDKLGDRDWGNNPGAIFNPAYDGTDAFPEYLIVNDARASNVSYGGVINSPGLLRGIQFGPGGTPMPFTYGSSVTSTTMNGGDGVPDSADLVLESPIKRYSGFGRVSYEVVDDITAFAEFNYSNTKVVNESILGSDQITVTADNAYLPASIRQTMLANGISSFVMGRSLKDYGRGQLNIQTDSWQATGGFKGKLAEDWSFDASYGYGKTHNLAQFTGSRITARWRQAIDAVVNPATGGIVCRSTLTTPGNGCIPMNLFGVGSVSKEAQAWITGTAIRDWDIRQQVAAATVRGEPFSTWAGPVSLAFGAEYRRQTVDVTSDPLSQQSAYRVGNAIPWYGKVTVKEAFAEVVLPLASDQSWAKQIDLDLAGRVTDYSTSGTVETWKVGLTYDINDAIRLRATRSRDIRAPSLDEMFAAGNTLIQGINDPVLGQSYTVQNIIGGNPGLKPEKADTLTAGIVLKPAFMPRLRLSLDYYDIKIDGAINTLGTSAIVTRCYAGQSQFCALITRPDPNGQITVVRASPANFQSIETAGVDFELAYMLLVGPGSLDLRALVNYTDKLNLVDGANVTHFAGNTELININGVGGTPHWRFNTSASFLTDDYRLSVTGRYVGGGIISEDNDVYNFTDKKSVNGRLYFDISGEVSIIDNGDDRKIALFGTIQNVTDQDPPITAINGYGTTRSLYDMIGRVYTAGVRFNF